MVAPLSLDVAELLLAYEHLGSVWKVGELFGIAHSTVHRRLRKAGLPPRAPEFTPSQVKRIREYYTTTPELYFNMQTLVDELGKSRHSICRTARRLGLSNLKRPSGAEERAKCRRPKWKHKPHPRGMAGKKHKPELKVELGLMSRRNWASWKTFGTGRMSPEGRAATSKRMQIIAANRPAGTSYTRSKGGCREDLGGIYFRSSWEANYARYLNLLIKFQVVESWEFEPETFWFEGVRRGAVSYLPDFRVNYKGDERPEYVEIKGWEVAKDRTKWRRMKKYHPHIKLIVVGAKEYYALAGKWASAIPNWEVPQKSLRVKM